MTAETGAVVGAAEQAPDVGGSLVDEGSAGGPRVLIVEPWLDGSHRRWAEGYRRSSRLDVDLVGLPGGLWRWRLRGGALPLADLVGSWVADRGRPDLLLISGLVDVAQLLGLLRRHLDRLPRTVVYQHESQLLYPGSRAGEHEAALRNWMSWCAADLVLFNSEFHRGTMVERLPSYLDGLPDRSHRVFLDDVVERFEVLPVGIDLHDLLPDRARPKPAVADASRPTILWPHRWEWDKDPAAFASALDKVESAGLDFGLILAGEEPPGDNASAATARREVADRFADRVVALGPFSEPRYRQLLIDADLVVSCADHEFFGVGVVEAIAAGCVPVLPHRLSYPEIVGERWGRSVLYPSGSFGTALVEAVGGFNQRSEAVDGLAESMGRFDWSVVAPAYDNRFAVLCS